MAYDPATGRLYISDARGYPDPTRVHVLEVHI